MPEIPKILEAAARHRAALLANERDAATEMTRLYAKSYEAARAQMRALMAEIRREAGGTPTMAQLYQRDRLGRAIVQVAGELKRFSNSAAPLVSKRQGALLVLAQKHSAQLLQLQGIKTQSRTVAIASVESLVGLAGNGSPLSGILDEMIVADGARKFREVVVSGLARGLTDDAMARDLAQNMGAPYARALTTLRTEGMRAYRESQREFNIQNDDVIAGVIWLASLSSDTCAACLSMHGSEHPPDYVMDSHPNCRCVLVPKTKTFADLGLKGRDVALPIQNGGEWFDGQSDSVKREILGPSKFAALKDGKIQLSDLRATSRNATWGGSHRVASLDEALKNADSRLSGKGQPTPPALPFVPEKPLSPSVPVPEVLDGAAARQKLEVLAAKNTTRIQEIEERSTAILQEIFSFNEQIDFKDTDAARYERLAARRDGLMDERRALVMERIELERQVIERAREEVVFVPDPIEVTPKNVSRFDAKRREVHQAGLDAFNRMVSSKIVTGEEIEFKAAGKARSSYTPGQKRLNSGNGIAVRVTVHELGHWLEAEHPDLLRKAGAFYDRRTAGEKEELLSKLTGNKKYAASEKARKDKFSSPYMGKEYRHQGKRYATEIVSMGMEEMYVDPLKFARQDPDYFDFIHNLLRGINS